MYTSYFIAYLCCLRCITKIILITMEITNPITAIANNIAKAMITPALSSELLSLSASVNNNNNNR